MVKVIPNTQNGLSKVSAVDCFQIRSVAIERLVVHIGLVESEIIVQVQEAISKVIGAL
jgi:mRNA interferase MazF